MANPRFSRRPKQVPHKENKNQNKDKPPSPSWTIVRTFLSFKHLQPQQHSQREPLTTLTMEEDSSTTTTKYKKMKCSGSLCSNTKAIIIHRTETSPTRLNSSGSSSSRSMKVPLQENNNNGGVVSSSIPSSLSLSSNPSMGGGGSFRGMPFRRLSGCYECRMVVDPVLGFTREPSLRASICSCSECGEIFMRAEDLELHQSIKHAVSELGPLDTSKNIVEIIFQSSWLKKNTSMCKIDRILKVHNTQTTISKFEEYRDSIKSKATKFPKKHPRCIADGNELLRFHCTNIACSLGLNGSTNLCNSFPHCKVCNIIKNGFRVSEEVMGKAGILTTATSGKAHDWACEKSVMMHEEEDGKRAMLVCRVIAGRVKKNNNGEGNHLEEYDSVAGDVGLYSNLEELYVFNPRAILPCFVVIYRVV